MKSAYLSELQNVRPQLDKDFDFGHCARIVKMTFSMRDFADHALGCKQRVFPDRWAIFSKNLFHVLALLTEIRQVPFDFWLMRYCCT